MSDSTALEISLEVTTQKQKLYVITTQPGKYPQRVGKKMHLDKDWCHCGRLGTVIAVLHVR